MRSLRSRLLLAQLRERAEMDLMDRVRLFVQSARYLPEVEVVVAVAESDDLALEIGKPLEQRLEAEVGLERRLRTAGRAKEPFLELVVVPLGLEVLLALPVDDLVDDDAER